MAMTKPAGVFLQLLSIPVMLGGCTVGITEQSTLAWSTFVLGLLMLYWGGKPARAAIKQKKEQQT